MALWSSVNHVASSHWAFWTNDLSSGVSSIFSDNSSAPVYWVGSYSKYLAKQSVDTADHVQDERSASATEVLHTADSVLSVGSCDGLTQSTTLCDDSHKFTGGIKLILFLERNSLMINCFSGYPAWSDAMKTFLIFL